MIYVNGKEVLTTKFPDGTMSLRYDAHCLDTRNVVITWKYDSDTEYMTLWYLVNHIRSTMWIDAQILLVMPYIPNARMDRVKNDDEVFTLKWFTDFINALHFCRVEVLDPHSNVAPALINNCCVVQPYEYVDETITAPVLSR